MTEDAAIRVLAVDDHPLVRKGVAAVMELEPGIHLVGEAAGGFEAIEKFRRLRPDVTLIDLRMPDLPGVDVILRLREESPDARFIALTSYDGDQDIYRALDAGVRGYLLKEMVHSEIGKAIRVVHSGARYLPPAVTQQLAEFFPEYALTPREAEVLRLVAGGLGNREIGFTLGTAAGTVKAHVQSILSKLGAKDRTHAVTIAVRRGIIHLNEPERDELDTSPPSGESVPGKMNAN